MHTAQLTNQNTIGTKTNELQNLDESQLIYLFIGWCLSRPMVSMCAYFLLCCREDSCLSSEKMQVILSLIKQFNFWYEIIKKWLSYKSTQ